MGTVHRTSTKSGSHFRTKHSQLNTVTRPNFQPAQPKKGQFLTFEDLTKAIRTNAKWTSGLFYRSYRAWPMTMYSPQKTTFPMLTRKHWKRLRKRLDGNLLTDIMQKFSKVMLKESVYEENFDLILIMNHQMKETVRN